MKIKSIRQTKKITGKKVLLRVDFNVFINRTGNIEDDYKIIASLPTIRFLLRYKCKIIIITHLGHPNGQRIMKYSTRPIAVRLSQLLGKKVKFIGDCLGFKVSSEVSRLKKGEILLLENLRFYNEEMENDIGFAKELASYADIYINEAFAVSHRRHASLVAIKNYLPAFAGLRLENEIKNLNKVINPEKPLVIIIGGVKIATRIPTIKKLYKKSFKILIGGALANNFLVARKFAVGKSLIDKKNISSVKKIINKNILLPVDFVVSDRKSEGGRILVRDINNIDKNEYIFDIGPQTIRLYSDIIKKAQTIIWNGPMGMFEDRAFRHGTLAIARVIAARSTGKAFGVVGGGETVAALRMTKMFDYVDWVSTGGGAMLTYLGGEPMPGLKGIVK